MLSVILFFPLADGQAEHRHRVGSSDGRLRCSKFDSLHLWLLRGRFKVPLYTIFATQAQDMTSQVLYLRHSVHDAIVYVRSQSLV